MRRIMLKSGLATMVLAFAAAAGAAQPAVAPMAAPPVTPYGVSIGIEGAKKVAAAALVEARRNNFFMVVAVVDTAGNLVYFEKMDNAQNSSVTIAVDKARSSALFRRPTKAFQDAVAQGGVGLRFLGLPGAVPVEGGIPLIEAGKIIGAIGLSGGSSEQDAQCAQAGAAVIK
jgi:glc operon protein GlcG